MRPSAACRGLPAWLWLASALIAAGCDLSDDSSASLTIITPEAAASFSSADDVDAKLVGTQIEVAVRVVGVAADAVVELYRLEAGEAVAATLSTANVEDHEARFRAFTLQRGKNELQARVQGSTLVSMPVAVSFRDACGQLAFVEPSPAVAGATEIRLGPNDDLDPEACGDTFTTRVIASTGLGDGTELTLLVNGEASGNAMTSGGVAKFAEVVLSQRGELPNRLSLQLSDSACDPVELAADVFVDCDGPRCNLGGPERADLSAADDEDALGAGLQLSFDVQTDGDAADVQLLINGDIDNAREAEVRLGRARFADVPLPEGTGVRVRALCRSARGATSSDARLFNVDTTPCTVAITAPLANTGFVAAQPSPDAPPASSLDIALSANVGSDCVSVKAAALDSGDCTGIEEITPDELVAGQGTLNAALTLSAQGAQFVCVQTADAAGNTALVNAPITFDRQAPMLTITAPAGPWTLGPSDDADMGTPACDVPITVSCDESGATVQLLSVEDGGVLASASCAPTFVASFSSVPLPSRSSAYEIVARASDAQGLVGSSEPRTITADCEP